jgi:flagellar hook-length control protein FliK
VAVGLPEAAGRDAEVRVGEAVVSAASDLVRTATARPHGGETPAETAIAQRDAVLEATARVAREPERPALPQQASVIGLPSLQGTPNAAPATVSPPPGAVVHAHLSPPLDSPSFAPALATQVRWLVHEGVSQAQLKLHPAEMGPVSVRIVLDGREARIDFGADVAATRQVLEASLPVLAAALDDSGIRMTGGSVRDGQGHPQHGHQPRGAPGGRSAATDPAAGHDTGTATAAAREARGLVDLLA